MTAINQAFIKLFPASPVSTTAKGRSAVPQSDVLAAAVVASLQQAELESATDRTLYSSPLVRLPDHRFEILAIGDTLLTEMSVEATYEKHKPALAENTDRKSSGIQTVQLDDHHKLDPAQGGNAETVIARSNSTLRPALEVDSFFWPSVCEDLRHKVGGEIRTIAAEIQHDLKRDKNVILITGHQRAEGRTSTAICLAAALSQCHERVVLIDADLQRPHLASLLGVVPPTGWESLAGNTEPLAEYLIESLADGFAILPLSLETCPSLWPVDLELPTILECLRDHYDVVLVDAMPIESEGPACSMLAACGAFIDSAILLDTGTAQNKTNLLEITNTLVAAGIAPLGVIRNAPPLARAA
jgi:Mrp family chromosome partitioning ATPase